MLCWRRSGTLVGESMQAEVTPILDEPTRAFVKRTLDAGLLELDDIKKVGFTAYGK